MRVRRIAFVVSLVAAAGLTGCSDDDDLPSGTTSTAAACRASLTLDQSLNTFANALQAGATENTLDLVLEPVETAIEALESTVPVDQRDDYRAVEQAGEALDRAVDLLPEIGAYSQDQVNSVKDEVAALDQANANLSAAMNC